MAKTPASKPAAFRPLYRQIKAALMRSLAERTWQPGEPIPSELELAERFKVSPGTVRKAIDELAAENILVRRQGSGTFVASHADQRSRYRFLRLADKQGVAPSLTRRLIDVEVRRADAHAAQALQLPPRSKVIRLRRLLLDQDCPVVFEEICLPEERFAGLNAERLGQFSGSLYRLFESEFGVDLIRASERIRAESADAEVAHWMALPAGAPLLLVERLAYTYGDQPVELRLGHCDTSRHHYHNELT